MMHAFSFPYCANNSHAIYWMQNSARAGSVIRDRLL